MNAIAFRRAVTIAFAVCLSVMLAGCTPKPSGKYSTKDGTASLNFSSGKVIYATGDESETCDYTFKNGKITVQSGNNPDGALTFWFMEDGSIQGQRHSFTKSK